MMGCQSLPKQYLPPLPVNLSDECTPVVVPDNGTGGVLLKWAVNEVYDHKACAYKHKSTVEFYDEMRELINGTL